MADGSDEIFDNVDFKATNRPHGIHDYDTSIISPEAQTLLNQFKIQNIKADLKYLHDHPHIKNLIMMLIDAVLRHRPADIYSFARGFFSQSKPLLRFKMEHYRAMETKTSDYEPEPFLRYYWHVGPTIEEVYLMVVQEDLKDLLRKRTMTTLDNTKTLYTQHRCQNTGRVVALDRKFDNLENCQMSYFIANLLNLF